MRLGVNLPEDLVAQIDKRAKALYISRSAYIATALAQKLQSDTLLDNIPGLAQALQTQLAKDNSNRIEASPDMYPLLQKK